MTFDAKQARELADKQNSDEAVKLLAEIKLAAEKGQIYLHIYKPLMLITVNRLEELGFSVDKHSSIVSQKDELFYTIKW